METKTSNDGAPSNRNNGDESKAYLLSEYSALREEILKRLEFEYQLVTLTTIIAGSILTFVVQTGAAESSSGGLSSLALSAAIIYPLIAMFLAAGWAQNDARVGQIRVYIRDKLEPNNIGWENYRTDTNLRSRVLGIPIGALAARGVFVTTQVLAIVVALSRSKVAWDWDPLPGASIQEHILIGISIAATALTFFLTRRRRPRSKKRAA